MAPPHDGKRNQDQGRHDRRASLHSGRFRQWRAPRPAGERAGSGNWTARMRALQMVSHGPEETRAMAAALGPRLRPGDFIALQGDLGAGKTLFVQGLCAGVGVTEGVRSPTFVLLHYYKLPPGHGVACLHHFDLYRLEDPAQLDDIGYEEFFWGEDACLVEWAERPASFCPKAGSPSNWSWRRIRSTAACASTRGVSGPRRCLQNGARMSAFAIECCTEATSVALCVPQGEGFTVWGLRHHHKGAQLRELVPLCQQLMEASGQAASEIQGVAVTHGPGTFTGIRIGIATAARWRRHGTFPCSALARWMRLPSTSAAWSCPPTMRVSGAQR